MPVVKNVDGDKQHGKSFRLAFLRVKAVCGQCNSTWMSRIDEDTKPILARLIRGESQCLNMVDQLQLATWATLKAFVFEVDASHAMVVTRAERLLLKEQRRPPGTVRVFLAAAEDPNVFAVYRDYIAGKVSAEVQAMGSAYATTFVLGHGVITVLGNPDTRYRPFALVGQVVRPTCQTVYPPVMSGAVWPPSVRLAGEDLGPFASTFISIRESAVK